MTNAGLQIRMTVFVTSAVLVVSAVILLIIAFFIRKEYESLLDDRISDDLAAISQSIEQRMLRVEDATDTMAGMAPVLLAGNCDIDSLLVRTLEAIDGVQGVSVAFGRGYLSGTGECRIRYAHFGPGHSVRLETCIVGEEIEENPYWESCFGEGQRRWSEPGRELDDGQDLVRCIVPLCDEDGKRIGTVCSNVLLSYITSFVTNYKVRKDIDISIYSAAGAMVVAPDDYILQLAPKDLLTRESTIGHLGWRVLLSADREIVDKAVREVLLSLAFLILLMFVVVSAAISLTVRYVAKPFVEEKRQEEKEKAVLDNELKLAASAQNELIPHTFPPFPGRESVDMSACLHPAREVGGDMYDYFFHGDKLHFCIGDVSGKGLQASLFMAATHYLFRSVAAGMPASDAVRQMNVSLCADNEKCRFVTFWYGCLDLTSGNLEYVNSGHDAPLLLRNGVAECFPMSENMPLGAWDEAEFVSCTRTLEPGDILLLYTDGVTEAMDAGGHGFGRKNLLEAAVASEAGTASDLMENVLARVRSHAEGAAQSDDITMLCLRFIKNETKS